MPQPINTPMTAQPIPSKKITAVKPSIRNRVTIPLTGGTATFITFIGLPDAGEHIALGFGDWETQAAPLVRVHCECLTGDVFRSGKCDCGEQLQESMKIMHEQGGIIIYLRQEGRGIGLYNKLDAYALQAKGYDTYEANRMLGFRDDQRNYKVAARMLQALSKSSIQLLTNNPDKVKQVEDFGIKVTKRLSTSVFLKESNKGYLEAKVRKTGHYINIAEALK